MAEPAPEVPNPYRASLQSARSAAVPVAADLHDDLDDVRAAMDRGAWVSSVAEAFYTDLTGHRTALGSAADGAMSTFDRAIGGQPETVPVTSWQTHWRNLR